MSASTCKVCDDPLLFEVEDEDNNEGAPQQVPDDLELACGCHFHWQCLLDQSSDLAISLQCPACQGQIANNPAGPSVTNPFLHAAPSMAILARYTSEGGVQDNYDILPSVTEEAYLAANPEARPARAFHVMCSEGDVEGIVELLRDTEEQQQQGGSEEETPAPLSTPQLLRYQDPLGGNKSGLHLAVEKGQDEVVWLLLWLASPLRTETFPETAVAAAQAIGLQRPHTAPQDDVRALRDDQGRTAEELAATMGGHCAAAVEAHVLRPGA